MKFEPLNYWDLKCSNEELNTLLKLVENKDLYDLLVIRYNFINEINEVSAEVSILKDDKENEISYYEKRDYMYELSDKINYLSHIIADKLEDGLLNEIDK